MSLDDEIARIRPVIHTDSYSMSVGELVSLYEEGELDIHPEFQRFYRWTDGQKARFIESLLLGIPIPPIFVSQRGDGVWDVIDGLQRLSTVCELMGILKGPAGETLPPLCLGATTYLPSLENIRWDDEQNPSFTQAQRLAIKRARFDVNIIQKESDELAKYEMFQRLNTGGSLLSDQEVRNCLLVWINHELFAWMRQLADLPEFRECALLSERMIEEQYDLELVVRFILLRTIDEEQLSRVGDVGDFLTDRLTEVARDNTIDLSREEAAFRETFTLLSNGPGQDSFRRYDASRDRFVGGFLLTPFEVFALGLGFHAANYVGTAEELRSIVKDFWIDTPGDLRVGSGVRASTRLPTTIPYGRTLFSR